MNALISPVNLKIQTIQKNGECWMTANDLAKCLGYKARNAVTSLYTRNKGEFTSNMSGVVNLKTPSGKQDTRIFSLRGAHLIAMLAKTKQAKVFRRQVLDLIEQNEREQTKQLAKPVKPDTDPLIRIHTAINEAKALNGQANALLQGAERDFEALAKEHYELKEFQQTITKALTLAKPLQNDA